MSTSKGGYGSCALSYMRDRIVGQYPNANMVFSAQADTLASRSDPSRGSEAVWLLGSGLTTQDNPVRLVTIHTKTGELTTAAFDPILSTTRGITTNTTIH